MSTKVVSVLLSLFQFITYTSSSTCRAVYQNSLPIVPIDVCSLSYTVSSSGTITTGSQKYKCWNTSFVIQEYYVTPDCTGEVGAAYIAFNDTAHTFDCFNAHLCEAAQVRLYYDSRCKNEGSYEEIPVVVDQCSYNMDTGSSTKYVCTQTAVEEYVYASSDCSGNVQERVIVYQNGDCDEKTKGYYEVSKCGDFILTDSGSVRESIKVNLMLVIFAAIFQIVLF